MRYEILGPLRVIDRDEVSSIGAPKVEMLLVMLLIRANHVVPTEQLLSAIWDEALPRRGSAGLHVYVSLLRKFLSRPGRSDSRIVTKPPGYLLQLGSDQLDAHEFLNLARRGREHAGLHRHEEANRFFESALGLWRGNVLGDLRAGPAIAGYMTWLTEERLECVEQLIDSRLALGRHREVVGRLYSLVAEHPFHEAFYRQLMLALYRSQRQADALKAYHRARHTLNTELGVEPCRALQNLHHAILVRDRRLEVANRDVQRRLTRPAARVRAARRRRFGRPAA